MSTFFDFLGHYGTGILRLLPPETSHDLGMRLLECGLYKIFPPTQIQSHGIHLNCEVPGIGKLTNPFGLAAGFDKNARCPEAFQSMGFSFLEIGTVTPKPQPGNSKPRIFRDSSQCSIINRMGFNSDGARKVLNRIESKNWSPFHVPMGINLGKNKDTPNSHAIDDYLIGLDCFDAVAKYFVINISSPNTPGLRELANPEFIEKLAMSMGQKVQKSWIKIDPDMPKKDFQSLVSSIGDHHFAGLILSNTHRVEYPQAGGQSGHPLLSQSNAMLEWAWDVHKGRLPMIGSGGILSGLDAFQKIARGACAVQLYSALVFRGPFAVAKVAEELALELKLRGFTSVNDAVGCWYKD